MEEYILCLKKLTFFFEMLLLACCVMASLYCRGKSAILLAKTIMNPAVFTLILTADVRMLDNRFFNDKGNLLATFLGTIFRWEGFQKRRDTSGCAQELHQ